MKSLRSYLRLCLILSLSGLDGCDYRDIEMEGEKKPTGVYFRFDWSEFPGEERPTGVTIYCYPKNGGRPYEYKSNRIDSVICDMPTGVYDILAFNQVEDEFETLEFSGMDNFSEAQVTINETDRPYWCLIPYQPAREEPEWFTLARLPDYELPENAYHHHGTYYIDLKPRNMIYTVTSSFRVYRSDKIYKNYGEMSGLASGLMLGSGVRFEPPSIHLFDDVAVYPTGDTLNCGHVVATFHSFGLPEAEQESKSGEPADNMLHYRFYLVDEKTICNYMFKVGDRITVTDSTMTMYLEIGYKSDVPQEPTKSGDPDHPGILPDVTPKHSSGMDAKIKSWEDEILVDL